VALILPGEDQNLQNVALPIGQFDEPGSILMPQARMAVRRLGPAQNDVLTAPVVKLAVLIPS
jgi:hypothetical protein